MLERIANLTWQRPTLVLGLVGAFVILAGILGRDVEDHLKAAGFTDSASESERAPALLREELGYDAEPGIVVLVESPAEAGSTSGARPSGGKSSASAGSWRGPRTSAGWSTRSTIRAGLAR